MAHVCGTCLCGYLPLGWGSYVCRTLRYQWKKAKQLTNIIFRGWTHPVCPAALVSARAHISDRGYFSPEASQVRKGEFLTPSICQSLQQSSCRTCLKSNPLSISPPHTNSDLGQVLPEFPPEPPHQPISSIAIQATFNMFFLTWVLDFTWKISLSVALTVFRICFKLISEKKQKVCFYLTLLQPFGSALSRNHPKLLYS